MSYNRHGTSCSLKELFSTSASSCNECPTTDDRKSQRHSVHVLFLQPVLHDPQEHFLNRLTSYVGEKIHKKGFHHVEIVVPDIEPDSGINKGGFLSSSIYNGETVSLTKTKTFANPAYTILTFSVSGLELSSILDYLHESKRLQLSFDKAGMFLAALPLQVGWRNSRRTFCSKHVTKALKAAQLEAVMDLNENIVTPSKLYKILHENIPADRKVAGSVQYKESCMLNSSSAVFSIF